MSRRPSQALISFSAFSYLCLPAPLSALFLSLHSSFNHWLRYHEWMSSSNFWEFPALAFCNWLAYSYIAFSLLLLPSLLYFQSMRLAAAYLPALAGLRLSISLCLGLSTGLLYSWLLGNPNCLWVGPLVSLIIAWLAKLPQSPSQDPHRPFPSPQLPEKRQPRPGSQAVLNQLVTY